jgi:hypothetical protein
MAIQTTKKSPSSGAQLKGNRQVCHESVRESLWHKSTENLLSGQYVIMRVGLHFWHNSLSMIGVEVAIVRLELFWLDTEFSRPIPRRL